MGAAVDEITNVFLMGAVAFALFGGELDRSRERWQLSEAAYQVALKAVSERREERFSSLLALWEGWQKAVRQN